jgi:hypothetical protein
MWRKSSMRRLFYSESGLSKEIRDGDPAQMWLTLGCVARH